MEEDQQLILKLENNKAGVTLVIMLVYAKWSGVERVILWESLEEMALSIQDPWFVGGDFNFIMHDEENLRGLPVTVAENEDFKHYINIYNLEDFGFKGSKYT